jgi:hypothetical protein
MTVALAPEMRKGQGDVEERHAIVKRNRPTKIRREMHILMVLQYEDTIKLYLSLMFEMSSANGSMIDRTELLFVRATNRRTLFGPYNGQALNRNDKRRGFAFRTRRET